MGLCHEHEGIGIVPGFLCVSVRFIELKGYTHTSPSALHDINVMMMF